LPRCTGQDNAEHKLLAFAVSTTLDPPAGKDTAFRGEVSVTIESEAHDTSRRPCGPRRGFSRQFPVARSRWRIPLE
jgi:hypothetical protein